MLKRIEEQIKIKRETINNLNSQIYELEQILDNLKSEKSFEIKRLDNLEDLWQGVHEFELVFPKEQEVKENDKNEY